MKKITIAIVLLFLITSFGCSNSNSKGGNESQESVSQIDSYDSQTANPSLVEKPIGGGHKPPFVDSLPLKSQEFLSIDLRLVIGL